MVTCCKYHPNKRGLLHLYIFCPREMPFGVLWPPVWSIGPGIFWRWLTKQSGAALACLVIVLGFGTLWGVSWVGLLSRLWALFRCWLWLLSLSARPVTFQGCLLSNLAHALTCLVLLCALGASWQTFLRFWLSEFSAFFWMLIVTCSWVSQDSQGEIWQYYEDREEKRRWKSLQEIK